MKSFKTIFDTYISIIIKLAGASLAGYGINIANWKNVTIGSAVAVITQIVDSVWNTPKGSPATAPSAIPAVLPKSS